MSVARRVGGKGDSAGYICISFAEYFGRYELVV
jgi:hypothetical protein